jgi:hypothetical protein
MHDSMTPISYKLINFLEFLNELNRNTPCSKIINIQEKVERAIVFVLLHGSKMGILIQFHITRSYNQLITIPIW